MNLISSTRPRNSMVPGVAALVVLSIPWSAQGATLVVDVGGTTPYRSIQPALDAAASGDTVLVKPGEYVSREPLDFNRLRGTSGPVKDLVLRSEAGATATTIRIDPLPNPGLDYESYEYYSVRSTLRFRSGETRSSVIDGFKITGAVGAGVLIESGSSPSIRRCDITGNGAQSRQIAAVLGLDGSVEVSETQIHDNISGGVIVTRDASRLFRCRILRNSTNGDGSGVVVRAPATASLEECEVLFHEENGVSGDVSLRSCYVSNEHGSSARQIRDSVVLAGDDWTGLGVGPGSRCEATNSVIQGEDAISIQSGTLRLDGCTVLGLGTPIQTFNQVDSAVRNSILFSRSGGGAPIFVRAGDPPQVSFSYGLVPMPGEGNVAAPEPGFFETESISLAADSPCVGSSENGRNLGAFTGQDGELIVALDDPGTSSQGVWYRSGGANPYNGYSLYANQPGARFVFTLLVPKAGDYDVDLWWTEWPSRLEKAPVSIDHREGNEMVTETVFVNQKTGGGRWNRIGRWNLRGLARVIIGSPGSGTVCANAVKIVPVNQDIVIDNRDPSTARTGTWSPSGGTGSWGPDSLYSKGAGATFSFLPMQHTSRWNIDLWWTQYPSRNERVQVDIADGRGNTTTVFINQRADGGKWNPIGQYVLDEEARITIVSAGGGSTCADAMRLRRASGEPGQAFEAVIDNGQPGTSFTGSWAISGGALPYGMSSLYSKTAGGTYSYTFTLPEPGSYRFDLWWTTWPSRPSSAQVDIDLGNGVRKTYAVNQLESGGQWNVLGIESVSGTTATVTIHSAGGASTCADAARVVRS